MSTVNSVNSVNSVTVAKPKINVLDFEIELPAGISAQKLTVTEESVETAVLNISAGKTKITVRENAVVRLSDGTGRVKEFVARSNTVPDSSGGFGQLKFLAQREVEHHPVIHK